MIEMFFLVIIGIFLFLNLLGLFLIMIFFVFLSVTLFFQDLSTWGSVITAIATVALAIVTLKTVEEMRNQRESLQLPHITFNQITFTSIFSLDNLFLSWTENYSNPIQNPGEYEFNDIGISVINDGVGVAYNVKLEWFFNSRKYLSYLLSDEENLKNFVKQSFDESFPFAIENKTHDLEFFSIPLRDRTNGRELYLPLMSEKIFPTDTILNLGNNYSQQYHLKLPHNFLSIYPIFRFARTLPPTQGGYINENIFEHDLVCKISCRDIFANPKQSAYIGKIKIKSSPCTGTEIKITGTLYFEEIQIKDLNKYI